MAKKDFLCNVIFKVLARGIVVLSKKDSVIKAEIDNLPEGYSVGLGVLPYGDYVVLKKENGSLYVEKKPKEAILTVGFKNARAAKLVMLAKSSIAESYCRHDLIVAGDISVAMGLVRAINRAEKYLFPHFMTKRFLPKIKKEYCSLFLYLRIFFTKLSK